MNLRVHERDVEPGDIIVFTQFRAIVKIISIVDNGGCLKFVPIDSVHEGELGMYVRTIVSRFFPIIVMTQRGIVGRTVSDSFVAL